MTMGTTTVQTYVVSLGELEDVDETYNTLLLVLPDRENIRMTPQDGQRLGHALFAAQGLSVTLNPRNGR